MWLTNIGVLQSFGMVLVVMGHSFPPLDFMSIPESFIFLQKWIYSFHMPLFIAISGFLFAKFNKIKSYSYFISKKALRLLVPYLFFLPLTTIIKALLSKYAVNPIELTYNMIFYYILYPAQASVASYWFLIILFLIFLLYPMFKNVMTMSVFQYRLILIILMVLHLWNPLQGMNIFALSRIFDLLIFFWCGCLIARYEDRMAMILEKQQIFFLSGLLLLGLNFIQVDFIGLSLMKGIAGIIMSWNFCSIYIKREWRFLDFMSGKTFCVYLLHGIVVVGVATILRKAGVGFYVFFPSMFVIGCLVPIMVYNMAILLKWEKRKIVQIVLGL